MKFARRTYPDIPGYPWLGSPCWSLAGRWIYFDADWNTRFPFGTSLCLRIGPGKQPGHPDVPGFTLDLNAPLGEPNRLYLFLPPWLVILGLPAWHEDRSFTGENGEDRFARVRCRPHLSGVSRYRYHRDDRGRWVRNSKPESLHWGWLTIDRKAG